MTNNRETIGRADGDKPASVEQPRQPAMGFPRGGAVSDRTPCPASRRSSDMGAED